MSFNRGQVAVAQVEGQRLAVDAGVGGYVGPKFGVVVPPGISHYGRPWDGGLRFQKFAQRSSGPALRVDRLTCAKK